MDSILPQSPVARLSVSPPSSSRAVTSIHNREMGVTVFIFTSIHKPTQEEARRVRTRQLTHGLATLPMKMMVFRATSLMRTRKGLLALKITLLWFSERPAMVMDVLAAASLPSSFTCGPDGKQTAASATVRSGRAGAPSPGTAVPRTPCGTQWKGRLGQAPLEPCRDSSVRPVSTDVHSDKHRTRNPAVSKAVAFLAGTSERGIARGLFCARCRKRWRLGLREPCHCDSSTLGASGSHRPPPQAASHSGPRCPGWMRISGSHRLKQSYLPSSRTTVGQRQTDAFRKSCLGTRSLPETLPLPLDDSSSAPELSGVAEGVRPLSPDYPLPGHSGTKFLSRLERA